MLDIKKSEKEFGFKANTDFKKDYIIQLNGLEKGKTEKYNVNTHKINRQKKALDKIKA